MCRPIMIPLAWGLLSAGSAQAACEFDVEVGDALTFSVAELTVEKTCEQVTVNLAHTGVTPANAMGHNWVLAGEEADLQAVATDGQAAGLENNYVMPDDDRVIASTSIVGGGETASVSFSVAELEAGTSYTYMCTFPGHWSVMQGTLKVE